MQEVNHSTHAKSTKSRSIYEPINRLKDFEASAPPPLQSNIKSDSNAIRYKTIWLAQQSYANRRDGIFSFFSSKAGELPP
jgi:hypothetical protein